MRLLNVLLLCITATTAQNDQVLNINVHREAPLYRVSNAYIVNSLQPLRIDIIGFSNYSLIETLHVETAASFVQIEVPHPAVMEAFPNLRSVVLPNVGMKRIANNSFESCENLLTFVINNNLIEEITDGVFKNCAKLNWLDISNNTINSIDDDAFLGLSSLFWLDLKFNRISSINSNFLKHTQQLEHLLLTGNPILQIQPEAFSPSLITLELGFCEISQLTSETFDNLPQLAVLDLADNPITDLPPNVFSNLTALRTLHLEKTKIRRLNSNSFGRLVNLTVIYIFSSDVDEIQPDFFNNFPTMEQFDIRDNLCANVHIYEVYSTDFQEDRRLHQCFANWFIPRETTTSTNHPPVDDSGRELIASGSLLIIAGLAKLLMN